MDFLVKKYINYARKCIGSNEFRCYFVSGVNKKIDILENGKFSCAKFVSELLYKFKLIKNVHVNVLSTVRELKNCGWKKVDINNLYLGDVLIWEKNKQGHYHIGFYIGDGLAISNSAKFRVPRIHHFTYYRKRYIKLVLRYES
ncbi:MAG: NlpC/P60 family protein [Patescibacteria group bacterium]|nr:NlpC/P60 family protein [Patescibacteria group bacterium]